MSQPGGSLIRKDPLGPAGHRMVRNEQEVLRRLHGVPGVPRLAGTAGEALLVQHTAGEPLPARAMPIGWRDLLALATRLARLVARVHGRGVMHRDICPANIVITDHGNPYLIDFSQALTVAEIRPEFTHHSQIVGSLAYLAPEQTGRTGRPVDQRADLYALGAVLYELATGVPPVGTGDPLRLSHSILARVPAPPAQANPEVPPALSDIIMHLLEKEPEARYQTAEGLLRDLEQLAEDPTGARPPVGDHDVPARLRAPTRLVGREAEIATLASALTTAIAGDCSGVVVSGEAGVGKTALINELRPIVTASDGWFVAGKFDQYRRDQDYDGVRQAFRALGRLLLSEPEPDLDAVRTRVRQQVGTNVGLAAAAIPELATLLRVDPDPRAADPQSADPLAGQARTQRTGIDVLRAIASPKRPVVFVVDDLQWAARTPLGFVDQILSGETVEGLLLVCAYRQEEVGPTHPLAPPLARWRHSRRARELHLSNLSPPSVARMVADILRTDPARSTALAGAVSAHTNGNPYDTIELLNALRQDNILVPTPRGWQWDPQVLRRRLAAGTDPTDVLTGRLRTIPPPTLASLRAMACLGDRVEISLLSTACGDPIADVEQRLHPALDQGLLVMIPGRLPTVRFRHDRVRETILHQLDAEALRAMRLHLARRLAGKPDLFAAAAHQYLYVADAVTDPAERHQVVTLFRRAAEQAGLLSNYATVEKLLAAATALVDPADSATLTHVLTARHAALYCLGRLAEADGLYRTIERLAADPLDRVDATASQINSLTNQGRYTDAVQLGLAGLRQLRVTVPAAAQLDAEVDSGIDYAYRWLGTPPDDDRDRPELTDPVQLAAAKLINRMLTAAHFSGDPIYEWFALAGLRMWAEHGPGEALVGPVSRIPGVLILRRDDYRTGQEVLRRVIAVGEARGYEPATSRANFYDALYSGHWSAPVEETVARSRRAREELVRGGDHHDACGTYYVSVPQSLEYLPTLDSYVEGVDAALASASQVGNESIADVYRAYRRLVDVLRGAADREAALSGTVTNNPAAVGNLHVTRALAATLLGGQDERADHTSVAMRSLPYLRSTYPVALAHVLRALSLAEQARTGAQAHRADLLAELNHVVDWLAVRADDARDNLGHLLLLVQAEQGWASGDFLTAVRRFEDALREASARQRPWHLALCYERAARFHLAHGAERTADALLSAAREAYQAWGAIAKVEQLDWAYPGLRAETADAGHDEGIRSRLVAGSVDLLGILDASQALSSETTIEGLCAAVSETFGAMTGATGVHLLLRDEEHDRWRLATGRTIVPVDGTGRPPPVPLTAVRYTERTLRPLLVADATSDDRFDGDPYFADLDRCALLVVPVSDRGRLRAMLLLENRLVRGAFTAERLDAVRLIAAQLAVSLDNVRLSTTLEHRVAERTEALALANQQLEQLISTDPLTGLPNRRRLERSLEGAWRRAGQRGSPVALAMIDVDHFKRFNDHYGHTAGDRCLERLAGTLRQTVRDTDLAARFGGEEFAVVMPDTDLDTAVQVARRLHTAVARMAEPHEQVPGGIVTISIGIAAAAPARGQGPDSLVEEADSQLYRAKFHGRNQVCAG